MFIDPIKRLNYIKSIIEERIIELGIDLEKSEQFPGFCKYTLNVIRDTLEQNKYMLQLIKHELIIETAPEFRRSTPE